ncbi:fasciclin domain family protein [Thozetella sp. PMI_491]|nr:fasciclin domain family protein [Thozetella sp. PMI_491]
MKFTTILIAAPVAAAFRLPDLETLSQIPLEDNRGKSARIQEDAASAIKDSVGSLSSRIADAISAIDSKLFDGIEQIFGDEDEGADLFGGRVGRHDHNFSNLTIYEIISQSNYTTTFAKLVSENQALVDLLNDTQAENTLFVPVDAAFDNLPDDRRPSPEFIEKVLRYHIGQGLYPTRRLLASHTIPTALEEQLLGDEPQRLRTRAGLGGIRLNFYNKVITANIQASNGIIHGVRRILFPPPYVGKELNLFPEVFSTYLLAMEKTDYVSFIHDVKAEGTTVFAPSNRAFARLGPRANAFLFNTERGLRYLKALLKYSTVANATLYSDAFYTPEGEQDLSQKPKHYHVELESLLEGAKIAVDFSRLGGWIKLRVNGYADVTVEDGIAKNGVIQVVDHVLIPPHRGDGDKDRDDGELEVEDLQARLAPYVESEGKHSNNFWSDL